MKIISEDEITKTQVILLFLAVGIMFGLPMILAIANVNSTIHLLFLLVVV